MHDRRRQERQVSLSRVSVPLVHQRHARGRAGHQGVSVRAQAGPFARPAAWLHLSVQHPLSAADLAHAVFQGRQAGRRNRAKARGQVARGAVSGRRSRPLRRVPQSSQHARAPPTGAASSRAARSRAGTRPTSPRTDAGRRVLERGRDREVPQGAASRPHGSIALGPMQETITESLSYLTDDDLHAMAAYLKSDQAQGDIRQ